jgi:hypothetical protein
MKKAMSVFGGIGMGAALFYGWRWYRDVQRIRNFHLTSDDLDYSDRSPQDLESNHLVDLNTASADQIAELGLSADATAKLLENRPYRNNLELVSRMILAPSEYCMIRDRIAVAEAREPVKIA